MSPNKKIYLWLLVVIVLAALSAIPSLTLNQKLVLIALAMVIEGATLIWAIRIIRKEKQ